MDRPSFFLGMATTTLSLALASWQLMAPPTTATLLVCTIIALVLALLHILHERYGARPKCAGHNWSLWFAWYPVRTRGLGVSDQLTWLRWVEWQADQIDVYVYRLVTFTARGE